MQINEGFVATLAPDSERPCSDELLDLNDSLLHVQAVHIICY